jgi:hypothetical protein
MSSNDELWGTFAVDDHLRKRAFVAELVLFDRLVLPQPPENDTDEYKRWTDLGWRPDDLRRIVKILDDLAVSVPWDNQLRSKWQTEYGSLSAAQRSQFRIDQARGAQFDFHTIKAMSPDQPAKWVTRGVLADALDPTKDETLYRKIRAIADIDPTADIEAVVGYGSFSRFREEVPVDLAPSGVPPDKDSAFLFQWDFVVPDDSGLDDDELLKRAVKLCRKDEFQDSRRQFHDWRRKLIAKRATVETARSEMDRCLAVYNAVVSDTKERTRVLRALQVLTAVAPLADLAAPGVGIVGGVVFGLGALLADRFIPVPAVGSREKFAALVHDSREAFGWREAAVS